MSTPLLSVIIPNYNHAAFLELRIQSVLQQSFQDFELIILDDCSTDKSGKIIEKYRNCSQVSTIIYNDANSGSVFKQWKKGISLAKGKYIWIAESDDWASVDFLEIVMGEFEKNNSVGICYSDSNWVDSKGDIKESLSLYSKTFFRKGHDEVKMHLIKYNTIQNVSAAVMKTALVEKYVDRITQYKACGDWCLYIDMLQESDLFFVGKKLNNFRWYHNNTSNNASEKGSWITEGLKIILTSAAYKIHFTRPEWKEVARFWFQKSNQFSGFKKWRLKFLSLFYLSIFRIKNRIFQLFSA